MPKQRVALAGNHLSPGASDLGIVNSTKDPMIRAWVDQQFSTTRRYSRKQATRQRAVSQSIAEKNADKDSLIEKRGMRTPPLHERLATQARLEQLASYLNMEFEQLDSALNGEDG